MSVITRRRLLNTINGCAIAASVSFTVLWLVGHYFYTSVGIDSDQTLDDQTVLARYYRFRYPGDGSVWLGAGDFRRSLATKPVEWFDLGGTVLAPPRRPTPNNAWNQWGFWWVQEGWTDPTIGGALPSDRPHMIFVGIPGWMPIVLTGALPAWGWYKQQRRHQ